MGGLARSYISLVQDLEKYVASLQSVMAEKERINAELSLASDIQAHIRMALQKRRTPGSSFMEKIGCKHF